MEVVAQVLKTTHSKIILGLGLLIAACFANEVKAAQQVKAYCFDFRVNKLITYNGTSDSIKDLANYGQLKIVLPNKTIYYPASNCITEYF